MDEPKAEYSGWGCLVTQFLLGGLFVWAGLAGSSRWRYGEASSLLMGVVILGAATIRTLLNLGTLTLARPKAAGVTLVLVAGGVIAGTIMHQRRADDAWKAARTLRWQQFEAVKIGMTRSEVERLLGAPGSWGPVDANFANSFKCEHSAGQMAQAAEVVSWTRDDGHRDRFVGYADTVVFTCFAVPCTAWATSDQRCIRWGP